MSFLIRCLAPIVLLAMGSGVQADIMFPTRSIATQTLSSPLFGGRDVSITAEGNQH